MVSVKFFPFNPTQAHSYAMKRATGFLTGPDISEPHYYMSKYLFTNIGMSAKVESGISLRDFKDLIACANLILKDDRGNLLPADAYYARATLIAERIPHGFEFVAHYRKQPEIFENFLSAFRRNVVEFGKELFARAPAAYETEEHALLLSATSAITEILFAIQRELKAFGNNKQ